MTYFGIRNHKSDVDAAVVNWSSFSNILKREIEPHWETLVEFMGDFDLGGIALPREHFQTKYDESQDFLSEASFKPLLYEQFDHLSPLWKDFKDKSFITNSRTMELLSVPEWEIKFELLAKEMTIENEKRVFYIINDVCDEYVEPTGSWYAYQRTSDIGYTQYSCKTKSVNGFDFHYTSKIDAFHEPSGEAIATRNASFYFPIDPDLATTAAFQCYLADIDKLLCTQRYENSVQFMLMSVNSLKELADCASCGYIDVDHQIQGLEKQMKQLADFVNENGASLIGKTVTCSAKAYENMVFSIN